METAVLRWRRLWWDNSCTELMVAAVGCDNIIETVMG